MTNFVRYETTIEALELVINETTGEVFASQRALARICGVEDTTILRFKGAAQWGLVNAQVQTSGGLQGAALYNEEQIGECLAKYNPSILAQCFRAGLRVYLYGLAGYEIKPQPKQQWDIPETLEDALILAGTEMRARKLAEAKAAKLEAKLIEQAPAVDFALAVQAAPNSIDFNAFAKSIGTGRTRLFRAMRQAGVIMKNSTLPYQSLIDAGYFEISQEIDEAGRTVPFALVTGKGQLWLKQRLAQCLAIQSGMVSAIAGSVQQSFDL